MHLQAVFIDRDGTIGGCDRVIYPGEFQPFPSVKESIQQLKKAGVLVCSFTNQPGISKGEASIESFEKELQGFGFDEVYICPHQHTQKCDCRKPSPGMLTKAAQNHNIDLSCCAIIGDRWTDLIAANEVGCLKIIVKTGAGNEAIQKYNNQEYYGVWGEIEPDYIAENLSDAVNWLLHFGEVHL